MKTKAKNILDMDRTLILCQKYNVKVNEPLETAFIQRMKDEGNFKNCNSETKVLTNILLSKYN